MAMPQTPAHKRGRSEESGRRSEESGRRGEESGRRGEESGRRTEKSQATSRSAISFVVNASPAASTPLASFSFASESRNSVLSYLKRFTSKEQWRGALEGLRDLRTNDQAALNKKIECLADSIDALTVKSRSLLSYFENNIYPLIRDDFPDTSEIQLSPEVESVFGKNPSKTSIMNHLCKLTTADEWGRAIRAFKKLPVLGGQEEKFNDEIEMMNPAGANHTQIELAEGLLKRVLLKTYRSTIKEHVEKRSKIGSSFLLELFGISWATIVPRMMVGDVSSEKTRAVKVERAEAYTTTINALSSKLMKKDAVVLTGESGSGKTVASMLGSTRNKNCYGVYLGAADVDLNGSDPDQCLVEYLERQIAESTGHSSAEPDFDKIEGAILSIILDELGSHREVLRTYLRLARQEKPGKAFMKKLAKSFGVASVRLVAVGTGCDDVIHPAGSQPDTYGTIFTVSDDGHAIWKRLMQGSESVKSALGPYVCALAGGLEVDGVVSKDVLLDVESHPEGFVSAGTGRALVGNARMAALIASQVSKLELREFVPESSPARLEASLPFIAGLHHQSVHAFVSRNALVLLGEANRMQLVAEALALTLSYTDANISKDMFNRLCTTTGVLTSCAVDVGNSGVVPLGRVIETVVETGDSDSGHKKRVVVAVEDSGRRYRVTESMAMMYLMQFGAARRPARTGEAFELCLLDYVKVALVPASIVARWKRSEESRPLSVSSPSAPASDRCGLFELLVEAFTAAGVSVGKVCVFQLPSKFEPNAYDAKGKATTNKINTLQDVWDLLEGEANDNPENVTVAVVLNADKAAGADMLVMCRGHFVLHIQAKSHQQTAVALEGLKDEYPKMGDGTACIACTAEQFPTHYYAIVRCVGPKTQMKKEMQQELTRANPAAFRYIEMQVDTKVFYPLVLVSNTKTKPALLSVSIFSR